MIDPNWKNELDAIGLSVDATIERIFQQAKRVQLPAQTTLFRQGDHCANYLIVIRGEIKVFTRAENGREIVLYRLHDGETCILTTACLLSQKHYPAEGVTETEVTAFSIPLAAFDYGVEHARAFRDMVFQSFSSHLHSLITLVEEVAFGKLDLRLNRYLAQHADGEHVLHTTHQELAVELGTAREVVSRQLKEMERGRLIELSRGKIHLLDAFFNPD